jgi:hypothetical protein
LEDRLTPGLYTELCDLDPESYAAERVPELLATQGVSRVTWWKTQVPGRTDLEMEITAGTLLGLAEVDDRFVAPAPLEASVAAHQFHRYPRPSQGILSGLQTKGLLVVWISPASPARLQELRDWGDFVHIRHIAAAGIDGFTQITVYENSSSEDPRFMHFYELDTEDTESVFISMAGIVARRIGGPRTEAFKEWADYRRVGGRLVLCNTYRMVGESCRSSA